MHKVKNYRKLIQNIFYLSQVFFFTEYFSFYAFIPPLCIHTLFVRSFPWWLRYNFIDQIETRSPRRCKNCFNYERARNIFHIYVIFVSSIEVWDIVLIESKDADKLITNIFLRVSTFWESRKVEQRIYFYTNISTSSWFDQ